MTQVKDILGGVAREGCHHFWVIESAGGPTSRGRCKLCGALKDFYNSVPENNPGRSSASFLELPEISDVEVDDQRNC